MSVYLSISPIVYLSIHLSIYPFISPSIHLSIHPSNYLFICRSVPSTFRSSVHLFSTVLCVDMRIRSRHKHVDSTGLVHHPYLEGWSPQSSLVSHSSFVINFFFPFLFSFIFSFFFVSSDPDRPMAVPVTLSPGHAGRTLHLHGFRVQCRTSCLRCRT